MYCTIRIYAGNYKFVYVFTEFLVLIDNYGLHAYEQKKNQNMKRQIKDSKTREIYKYKALEKYTVRQIFNKKLRWISFVPLLIVTEIMVFNFFIFEN